jgi:hypothetical protein
VIIFGSIKLYFNYCCNILDQPTDYRIFFKITHKHKKELRTEFETRPLKIGPILSFFFIFLSFTKKKWLGLITRGEETGLRVL